MMGCHRDQQLTGIGYSLLSITLFALVPILDKLALHTVNPAFAVFIVYTYNTIFSTIFVKKFLTRNFFTKIVEKKWCILMPVGNALGAITLFIGLDYTDPVTVAFLRRFYVIFTLLFGYFWLGEKFTHLEKAIIPFFILGGFIFIYDGELPNLQDIVGILLIFTSAFGFAYGSLVAKRYIDTFSTREMLAINCWGVLGFISIYLLLRPNVDFQVSNTALTLLFFSALSVFGGLGAFYAGLRYLDFWKANIMRTVQPILVIIFSLPFFPQTITSSKILGGSILIMSLLALLIAQNKDIVERLGNIQLFAKSNKGI